jgi:hypothetical protein
MHYSSGVLALASFSIAQSLPAGNLLWWIARVLLDVAGGLFLLYMLLMSGLSLWVALSSRPGHGRGTGPRHAVRGAV